MRFRGWDKHDWGEHNWGNYVSAADRRLKASREAGKLTEEGRKLSPVKIEGQAIATTFWGKSWCQNLERYSDFANRLPRGRTYARQGAIIDLQIGRGAIDALVSGSSLYEVSLKIKPVGKAQWEAICADCTGRIDSLMELLRGRVSDAVMERICRKNEGLFPTPREIEIKCSCPDWAGLCKHAAAVLYGIGARFDAEPELLFRLREVDATELIAGSISALPLSAKAPRKGKLLDADDLGALFGLDMAMGPTAVKRKGGARKSPAARSRHV